VFNSLKNHTHYSLQLSPMRPHQLVHRAWQIGSDAVAITDTGSISCALDFHKACKETCECGRPKKAHPNRECETFKAIKMKPILGCEFNVCKQPATEKDDSNIAKDKLYILAKNYNGWKTLIKLVSLSHKNFYKKPRVSIHDLKGMVDGNLICYSGSVGTELGNLLWEGDESYGLDEASLEMRRKPNQKELALNWLNEYIGVFGKDNVFVEIQDNQLVQNKLSAPLLREVAEEVGVKCIATNNVYYPHKEDKLDQQVLMASLLKCKIKSLFETIIKKAPELNFVTYSSNHMPNVDELENPQHEIDNTKFLSDLCEEYKITSNPIFPNFECPDSKNPTVYLRELCREGWKRKIQGKITKEDEAKYVTQIKEELDVFEEYKLDTYFLVVQDYIRWAKKQMLVGPGRGSVGGSLAAYLLDITEVDPIPFGLYFSRFINKGRLSKDHISLPDIDTDFPKSRRGDVIRYLQEKYGYARVAQICNFGTMKGRSAITDVFSTHDACSFQEIKNITECIPEESKISDDLQEMIEEEGEASIIKWTLENNPESLSKWCEIDSSGNLTGDYAEYFKQAIRLEGCKRSIGRHASGIIISGQDISELAPIIQISEETEDLALIGYDMHGCEMVGLIKMDILGLTTLDRLMKWQEIMATQES